MYSRADLRSISLKGGQRRRGKRLAGLIRAGAPARPRGRKRVELRRIGARKSNEGQGLSRVSVYFTSSWLRESSDSL
jgi:hypothetical protein